jgi:hypothetical protein
MDRSAKFKCGEGNYIQQWETDIWNAPLGEFGASATYVGKNDMSGDSGRIVVCEAKRRYTLRSVHAVVEI